MRKLILLLLVLVSFVSVDARQINEQEAQMKAQQFFGKANQSYVNRRNAPRKTPKLVLANDREELYIFNDDANGGYVVISGDDRLPDVLAFSYDGLYDEDNIPSNMKAWMDDYADQVAYLRTHPQAKVKRQNVTERQNIAPLLTCGFGQGSPYNDKCPEVDGSRCPTGCVATAMAQIMHYWQWPKQTTDVIPGYTTISYEIAMPEQPITTIDWDNIRGDYKGTYSDEQANAVSTLMLLCGTAVTMNYAPSVSLSSAYQAAVALRNYFNYDDILDVINRGTDADEWEQIIYEELKDKRPVYYGDSTDYGAGHAFVMDGYENGYFHVNWGWGGSYSYILMTNVGGFNNNQSAIVGIQPINPNTPTQYAVLSNGRMTLYYDDKQNQRSGTILKKDEWSEYKENITECVIDPSMSDLRHRSLSKFFAGLSQLRTIEGIENLNTDYVADMSSMFNGCSSLTSLDLCSFNTENVTDMNAMFYGCSSLSSLDVSGFNTENVTDMWCMFDGCSSLTSLDVSGFNTVNVKYMQGMFQSCSCLTSLDVSGFNTGNVTNMNGMFNHCSSLTSLDVSGFNTDNVIDMDIMFQGCSSLTTLDVSGFNTEKVMYMSYMFRDCSKLTDLNLTSFNTNNVTGMWGMFWGCSSLTSLDLSNFNTSNVTDMKTMFFDCSSLKSIFVGAGWTTGNVTDGSYMFWGCSRLVGGLGTRYDYNHTDHTYAHLDGGTSNPGYFRDKNLPAPPDLYTVLSDNNTILTFYYDYQMKSRGGVDFDERQWQSYAAEIINVVFDESFAGCTTLTSTDSWFNGCENLKSITGIGNLKTDNVRDMRFMFYNCSSLTSLDLSSFKTDNVELMICMFNGCSSLTSLDLSGFNTGNVTNMNGMFHGCSSLKSIFVGAGWTTGNVTDGSYMFWGCSRLVGGLGTRYDYNHTDHTYAHLDGGTSNPGYFSDKNSKLFYLTYMIDGEVYKTISLVYGTTIIPEDEPIKEGYTFGGWSELPERMPAEDIVITGHFYLFGDVNIDEEVDVLDVVDIARFVVAMPSESFKKELADLNYDATVNIADAVVLVNHIAGDQNFVKAMVPSGQSYNYDQCQLQLLNAGQNTLSLCLDGDADFTAFQFDVDVPEGTDISTIHFNSIRKDGHQLLYNKVSENSYRVTALSLTNAVFKGNMGELLQFSINGQVTDDICIHDIHFVNTKGNDFTFAPLYLTGITETGIGSIENEIVNGKSSNGKFIYDLQGRKLSKVQHGVNIVNGKKIVVK